GVGRGRHRFKALAVPRRNAAGCRDGGTDGGRCRGRGNAGCRGSPRYGGGPLDQTVEFGRGGRGQLAVVRVGVRTGRIVPLVLRVAQYRAVDPVRRLPVI